MKVESKKLRAIKEYFVFNVDGNEYDVTVFNENGLIGYVEIREVGNGGSKMIGPRDIRIIQELLNRGYRVE
jgi:hypothetical protein